MEPYDEGVDYYLGINGHEKNELLAYKFLNSAVEHRDMRALYFLASVARCKAKLFPHRASYYYTQAFSNLSPLVFMWQNGSELKIDKEQLFDSLLFLGLAFEKRDITSGGLGIPDEILGEGNQEYHIYFYELAADLGYGLPTRVSYLLGLQYFEAKNYLRAYTLFELIQNTKGMYRDQALVYLGLMHEAGIGVEKDYLRAIEYYKKVSPSMNLKDGTNINQHIGNIYLKCGGLLVSNSQLALTFFRKALEQTPTNIKLIKLCDYYSLPVVQALYSNPPEIVEEILEHDHPAAFTCPISLNLMLDPVIINDTYSYERSEIEGWFRSISEKVNSVITSPINRQIIFSNSICTNRNLAQAIAKHIEDLAEKLNSRSKINNEPTF